MRFNLCLLVLFGAVIGANCSSEYETEEEEIGNGQCSFREVKQVIENHVVSYEDIETYMGRCRGAYFRRCVNYRSVQKTRTEPRMVEQVETVQKCCDGYVKHGDECLPFCSSNCNNGDCTAPNTCTCNDGYVLEANSTHNCMPDCTGCTHGTCLTPQICQCNAGYVWESASVQCVPTCLGGCHNGDCVAPGTCVCHAGYDLHENEELCIPHCSAGCSNGECTAPEQCVCFANYRFANGSQHECEPICELSCRNGKCTEPNVCECHSGYVVADELRPHECHCGQYCVEIDGRCHCLDDEQRVSGYQLENDAQTICTRANCEHGFCASPFDCQCVEGFEKNENSTCVANNETCIDASTLCNGTAPEQCDCINGVCAANGTCFCLNGYQMSGKWANRCEPQCSQECTHGTCNEIDSCACDHGYQVNSNLTWHVCEPICSFSDGEGCANGTCIAPDKCGCFEGFELSIDANFTCVPTSAAILGEKSHWFLLTGVVLLALIVLVAVAVLHRVKQRRNASDVNYAKRMEAAHNRYDAETLISPSEEL